MQNDSNPEYLGDGILSEIDANLVKYSKHVVGLILNSVQPFRLEAGKILDFGAGQGTLSEIFRNQTGIVPFCAELDPKLLSILEGKGFPTYQFLSEVDTKFDLIYSSNVLEHIEFDVRILKILVDKLEPGGRVAIYVPAFPILFSKLDQNVGHFRRYKKKELVEKLEMVGLKVLKKEYTDSVGFFATLLLKSVGFSFSPNRQTSYLMQLYDNLIVPISIALDRICFKYMFGKNLFVVAELAN